MTGPAGLRARMGVRRGSLDLQVDLRADSGEVVAVLGPNGAGKSSLLRALAGLLPLDTGRVGVGPLVLEDAASGVRLAPPERGVGLVPQGAVLFPHLTTLGNVAFSLRVRGRRRADAESTALQWLRRLGVAELADRRPAALSGGQTARVALARALAGDPRLVLLDEPLAALDVTTRSQVRALLRARLPATGAASLLVTHDPLDALTVADRLVVLEGGRVRQDSAPAEVVAAPATPWVAALVGTNLWVGDAQGSDLRLAAGGELPLPVRVVGPHRVTLAPAEVALRPLTADAAPAGAASWEGTVVAIELLAGRARVQVAGPPDVTAELPAQDLAAHRWAAGARVHVEVRVRDLVVTPDLAAD